MDLKNIKQRLLRKEASPAETPWQRANEEMKKRKERQLKEKKEEAGTSKGYAEEQRLPKEQMKYWERKLAARKGQDVDRREERQSYRYWYLFFLTGALAMGYFVSPYGKVKEIFVEGATYVPEQSIIDASRISGKMTALGVIANSDDIDAYISGSLPQIKKTQVKLANLNNITIDVKEYDTIAYVYSKKEYYNVFETGVINKAGLKVPIGNRPIITNFELNQNLDDLLEQYMQLTDAVKNSISEIKYTGTEENPYSITAYMNDGNEIKAVLPTFAEKILYYPDILSQLGDAKGTIDLEVGVYFTPFTENKKETDASATEKPVSGTEQTNTAYDPQNVDGISE